MKLENIIRHTMSVLPLFNDQFTTNTPIISITKSGNDVTVNATNHGLEVGNQVLIANVKTDVVIDNITASNGIAIASCAVDHDLTLGYTKYVEITSPEAAYSGSFAILDVPSRTTFSFKVEGDPADNTGVLHTFENIGFNGVQDVTEVIDADNYKYNLQNDRLTTGSGDNMLSCKSPRITGAADLDTAIATYTNTSKPNICGYFVFQNMSISDDRSVNNDSKAEKQRYEDFKLRLINDISFYVFIPTDDELTGRAAIDQAQSLAKPIYKTLAKYIPTSEFITNDTTPLIPTGHSVAEYNRAFLVYSYDFQATEFMLSSGFTDDPNEFIPNSGDTLPNFNTRNFNSIKNVWNNDFNVTIKENEYQIEG